jgi:ABC-2 type transport system permease protein
MTEVAPAGEHLSQRTHLTSLTFGGVLRSEWIKLRTLRSTIWSSLVLVVLALGTGLVISLNFVNGNTEVAGMSKQAQADLLVQGSTFDAYFGQFIVAVVGVLIITGEYSTGMIRSTLAAVPNRMPVLAAKALVVFAATFVVEVVATIGAFFAMSVVFADRGISANLLASDVISPLLGAGLYLALVAVFALGVGTILRSSAGGIAIVVAILLGLPLGLQNIPADWVNDLAPYALSAAGSGLFSDASTAASAMPFWENLLVVLCWVAVSLTGAAVLLKQRDA